MKCYEKKNHIFCFSYKWMSQNVPQLNCVKTEILFIGPDTVMQITITV